MNKNRGYILIGIAVVIIIGLAIFFAGRSEPETAIASFEECVAAGNPVMESFPRQCRSAGGQLFVEQIDEQDEPMGEEMGETVTVTGTIKEIDQSQIAADGPYMITIESASGETKTVSVPSFGMNLCATRESIADIAALEVGQKIEVRGEKDTSGAVTPCVNPEDYLKVVSDDVATLSVGETAVIKGLSITLNEVVQESRCPVDAECIEAGAITVNVTLRTTAESPATEIETQTFNMASDEVPHQFSAFTIAITNIAPPLRSGEMIAQEDYRITFAVKPR